MPLFRVRFTKFAMLDDYAYKKPAEPIFQTFELPLRAFGVDDEPLRVARLRFDKTVSRVVILSQMGLESGNAQDEGGNNGKSIYGGSSYGSTAEYTLGNIPAVGVNGPVPKEGNR